MTYFIDYYKAHKQELPVTLWRDSPVQHFRTAAGDYQWPIPGDSCTVIEGLELRSDNTLHALVSSSQVHNTKVESPISLFIRQDQAERPPWAVSQQFPHKN